MIPYERRQKEIELLEGKEITQITELCGNFNEISESTIRRDLKALEGEGVVTLLGGGGICLRQGTFDTPVDSKFLQHTSEKERIAQYAASLVKDGDAIYIDAGSTPLMMIRYLKDKTFTIVTTNALVQSELQKAKITDSQIQCIVMGGEIKIATASIVGTITNQMLEGYYFDKAFLGTSGISKLSGFNTPDLREAEKKRIVRTHSTQPYILADSSKYNITTLCKVFDLGEVPLLVDADNEMMQEAGNYTLA